MDSCGIKSRGVEMKPKTDCLYIIINDKRNISDASTLCKFRYIPKEYKSLIVETII